MASIGKPHKTGGKFRAIYIDTAGKRKFVAGTRNKKETLAIAQKLEDDHRQVRLGYRDAPTSARKHRNRSFDVVLSEYLAWGESHGGRGGRPWSRGHAQRRRSSLTWWKEQLGLETLADLVDGVLPRVEKALQGLQKSGRAGKTLHYYAEALKALCNWCVQHGYLAVDPIKDLTPFDTTPQTIRRAMTEDEIKALLVVAPEDRALLYQTAFLSGLRSNELRNLELSHLDLERCGLHLDAEWTKNRKPGFQPIPRWLAEKLYAFAVSEKPSDLYSKAYRRGNAKHLPPTSPLLYVPSNPARSIDRDLVTAQIPKVTLKGKLDFHACRTAYISLLLETGELTPKEVQELARHQSLDLTMHVYGRVRDERLAQGIERMSEAVFEKKRAIYVQRLAVGEEPKIATPFNSESCDSIILAPRVGLEPTTK